MQGGESGRVIEPGDLDASYLWELVNSNQMPPKKPLSDAEKRVLRNWIVAGARWGSDPINPFRFSTRTRAGYDWWSLQPLSTAAVPPGDERDTWSRNEVDRFILAQLKDNGLTPSPRADPRTLVRRLYVDLIGLAPPVEVVERFAEDPSQPAWERLIDELLESPHYGERWARHWMDVVRFGESDGYEYNRPRDNAWQYRDWLIRAFNEDLPYDQFVRMQLAGDLLRPQTIDGAAAVGMLVAGTHNTVLGVNEMMKQAARHDELEELAATVAQTFLGLTVHCARCHDHKFDPITSREYYQFIAALDGVRHGERTLPQSIDDRTQQLRRQRMTLLEKLCRRIAARGELASTSANVIQTKQRLPANAAGRRYRVSFQMAPTVWANASQASSALDGVQIRMLKSKQLPLVEHIVRPGAWNAAAHAPFRRESFEYTGDGDGDLTIQLAPFPPNSGRFGGAVDDLTVHDLKTGELVFEEKFDDLRRNNRAGRQADTSLPVHFGATSDRWKHSGLNSIHAVEHAAGNLALQLFGGTGGAAQLVAETPAEKRLRSEILRLEQRLAGNHSKIYTVVSRDPGVMRVLSRGDVASPGEAVAAGGLKAINSLSPSFDIAPTATDAERRLRLAKWITAGDNPLLHRVAVNRIWQHHFGRGLVSTPSDFGFNGGRPSHPELLDWLSVWFRDHHYSMKRLHRLIVRSAAYQQASKPRDEATRIDGDNLLLARQNPRRIEAEVLRDSILDIAGQLNRRQFGPGYRDVAVVQVPPAYYYSPLDPVGDEYNRRTIYRWHVRGRRGALLDTFDCPDPSTTTPLRSVTTTPSQALSLWNDSFITRMSERLAERIKSEVGEATQSQVDQAWRRTLARSPTARERQQAVSLVEKHGLPLLCRVLFNCNEFIVID